MSILSEVEAVVVVNVCLRLRTVAALVVAVVAVAVGEVVVTTIPDDVEVLGCSVTADDGDEIGIGAGLDFVATTEIEFML